MRRSLLLSAAVLGVLLAPTTATAQLNLISPACGNSNALTFMGAQQCRGAFDGNNKNQQAAVLAQLATFGEGPWTVVGSSDDDLTTFGPFTSNPGTTTGTLTFDSFITGSFAIAVKAGNAFSLYYFTNTAGTSTVLFTTAGTSVNANNVPNGLSHATLYRLTGGGSANVVPEPSTYALMATGLVGLIGMAKRRRQTA